MRVYDFNRGLMRAPSPSIVAGLRAVDLGPPDFAGVVREHDAYLHALEDAGLRVEVLPPLSDFPDSVFVEDVALVHADAAIVLRPGAPTRMGEAREITGALEQRFERVFHLGEGFVDGGDVLTTPCRVFIGQSARTNAKGAQALVSVLARIGLNGVPVSTPRDVLHLKSDCSLLDEETVLVTARLAATDVFKAFRIVPVPGDEEGAANAVRVNDRVLVSNAFPRTADLLADAGYSIVPLPAREVAKLDAGLSCMSLRWCS